MRMRRYGQVEDRRMPPERGLATAVIRVQHSQLLLLTQRHQSVSFCRVCSVAPGCVPSVKVAKQKQGGISGGAVLRGWGPWRATVAVDHADYRVRWEPGKSRFHK